MRIIFLKKALISERKSVNLYNGIELSNVLVCNYKITHFLRHTEIFVPFYNQRFIWSIKVSSINSIYPLVSDSRTL
jgi:hypothetical protein